MSEKNNNLPTSEFKVIPWKWLVEIEIVTWKIIATIKTSWSIRPNDYDEDPNNWEDEYIQHRWNLDTQPNQN